MYGCDCDGVKREPLDLGEADGEARAMRGHIDAVERVTGHRPPTCPWRAMYEPLVKEAISAAWDPSFMLGPDPEHRLKQAVSVYARSRDVTVAAETKQRAEEDKAKRAATAAVKGRGRG